MSRTTAAFLPLLCYLLTGTAVTTISQVINNKVTLGCLWTIYVWCRFVDTVYKMIHFHACLQHFTSDSVQALACIKYLSTLLVSLTDSALRPSSQGQSVSQPRQVARSPKQKQLILVIGCVDVMAYAAFCTGFAFCDGAIATLVLAAGGQIFTAIMSKYILKKQLTRGQVLGVCCSNRTYAAIAANATSPAS